MRIDGAVFKKTWKRIVKDSPFLTCVLFVKTFLTAVRPFVILHFSAEIINGLYRGTDVEEILFQAVWLSVSAMAIEMGCHLTGGYVEEAVRKSAYGQSQDMLEKAMGMNYQQMESSRVQSLVESIRQCEVQRGNVFTKEIQFFEKFYTGAFVVASSLFYVSQFAVEKLSWGGKSGQFIPMLVCFVVLTVVAAAVTVRNGIRHNDQIFKRFGEVAHINRRYMFYRRDVFQNYKYGKEIRIFDESGLIQDEFGGILKRMQNFLQSVGMQESIFRCVNSILNVVLSGIAYVYIGLNAYRGVISVGSVVKYSGAVMQLFMGIMQSVGALADLKGNEKFLRQYYDFLEMEEPQETEGETLNLGPMEIAFENIYFKYPGAETWALENISFHISNQEHVAMVGRNGSGKTTCVKLMLRLYKPDSGKILLNGRDIWQYNEKEYWKRISVVFQDFKLFSVSLEQNLAGERLAEQRLWHAIREVGMDKTVEKMYAGTESCLYKDYDERGVLISGGEAQKLAIAKALYKDAPLFIMDEPSAALDPVSEAELYEKVNTLMKDKTILFISHRLSSCCFCDRILVWKNGRIIEDGSHEELLGRGREYRELWDAQAMYYQMKE